MEIHIFSLSLPVTGTLSTPESGDGSRGGEGLNIDIKLFSNDNNDALNDFYKFKGNGWLNFKMIIIFQVQPPFLMNQFTSFRFPYYAKKINVHLD